MVRVGVRGRGTLLKWVDVVMMLAQWRRLNFTKSGRNHWNLYLTL